MKKLEKALVFVFFFFLYSPFLFAQDKGHAAPIRLTILHVNDVHGHILPYTDKSINEKLPVSGAAYLAKMIEEERALNPDGNLLLSAGDMFQGSPISNLFSGQPVIEIMNYLQFDGMALGNHEFDWGRETLDKLRSSARFPFLSSNIVDKQGNRLEGVKPYALLTRKNLKIAVIGLTTPETAYGTKPANVSDLTFLDPVKTLPGIIEEVRSQGANLVVVLSHLGLDEDKKLAQEVSGIDVIVGGHSHTAVIDPVQVRQTIIVQAGSYGLYLGVLNLAFDPSTQRIVDYTKVNELKTVYAGPENPFDEKAAGIVAAYNDQIKAEFQRVVGETTVDLVRRPYEESNIGNLIADAMREISKADMAFQNGGGIRADLPAGKITMEEVFTLLPFDNSMVLMDLTGSQVLLALKQNSSTDRKILQISGLGVQYNPTAPAEAERVMVSVEGKPIDPAKVYRVVTNDFVAAGGDRFTVFQEGANVVYDDTVRDGFLAYLKKHSPVAPKIENRIIFKK